MDPFITTFTGRKVNPLALKSEDISILDIAHHLATLNRFVGALKRPVSIAQHSVFVSRLLVGTLWEREGLFHDAPETYLGDVSKWVKQSPVMAGYREADQNAWVVICVALHLSVRGTPELNKMIREADDLMVRYENLKQGAQPQHMFELPSHPRPTEKEVRSVGVWSPWTWRVAEKKFLEHARLLGFKV